MKKTNVLVEFTDDIYDLVVAPHKKDKTFSKLVASLLTGYLENDYIRAYAEGTLDDMHRASVDALGSVLGDMQQSLSSLGLYTSELKANNEDGMEAFSQGGGQDSGFGMSIQPPVQQGSSAVGVEVEELKSNVDELKKQNSEIMSMLQSLLQAQQTGSVTVHEVKSTPVQEVKNTPVVKPEPPVVREEVVHPVDDTPSLVEVEDEGTEVDADSVLSNLLSGSSFSF